MTTDGHHHTQHEHDLGLQHDVQTLHRKSLGRRGLLGVLGGLGAAGALAACTTEATPGAGAPPDGDTGAGMGGDSSVEVAEGEIPEETAGPYPGDGSSDGYSQQLATVTGSVEEGYVATLNVPI